MVLLSKKVSNVTVHFNNWMKKEKGKDMAASRCDGGESLIMDM